MESLVLAKFRRFELGPKEICATIQQEIATHYKVDKEKVTVAIFDAPVKVIVVIDE